MRMGQGVRTDLGHGGITCVLQVYTIFWFILDLKPRKFEIKQRNDKIRNADFWSYIGMNPHF